VPAAARYCCVTPFFVRKLIANLGNGVIHMGHLVHHKVIEFGYILLKASEAISFVNDVAI